jgi:hypothetical protein
MAPEVELPTVEATSEPCAGCGKKLDFLEPHLKIAVKPERGVIVEQSVSDYLATVEGVEKTEEDILAAVDVDEEEEQVHYLGWRSGAGDQVRVHNGDCAQEFFSKKYKAEKPKIKLFRPEEDHYEHVGRSSE